MIEGVATVVTAFAVPSRQHRIDLSPPLREFTTTAPVYDEHRIVPADRQSRAGRRIEDDGPSSPLRPVLAGTARAVTPHAFTPRARMKNVSIGRVTMASTNLGSPL